MHLIFLRLPIILFCISGALADFLGPSYPAPVDLTSHQSLVAAGWRNITSTLQRYIDHGDQDISSGAMADIKNLTFSLGMFSLNDPAASELQFHYTSPETANAPNGTHKVDENSIYRFASLTKVFTVLAVLKLVRYHS
jgi:CubicO group peptidase (beta-lactamase class C family)